MDAGEENEERPSVREEQNQESEEEVEDQRNELHRPISPLFPSHPLHSHHSHFSAASSIPVNDQVAFLQIDKLQRNYRSKHATTRTPSLPEFSTSAGDNEEYDTPSPFFTQSPHVPINFLQTSTAEEVARLDTAVYDRSHLGAAILVEGGARARFRTGNLVGHGVRKFPEAISTRMKADVVANLIAAVQKEVAPVSARSFAQMIDILHEELNRTVSRSIGRQLTLTLTESLTHSITQIFLKMFADSLVVIPARQLTHSLTAALTDSLALTVSTALTRRPIADYYCYLCRNNKRYCADCRASMENQYYMDYYTSFYSHYYLSYYLQFYDQINPYDASTSPRSYGARFANAENEGPT